jgi:hypothetical protein
MTSKYQPISLCKVFYKIITNVISNHINPLVPFLISPEQMGYVEGRKILDCIILAHEITHFPKIKRKPRILLKLNLSKAFDKLS